MGLVVSPDAVVWVDLDFLERFVRSFPRVKNIYSGSNGRLDGAVADEDDDGEGVGVGGEFLGESRCWASSQTC